MSTGQVIQRLLAEWSDLSNAEGGAIASAAWPKVKNIQVAKQALKNLLTQAQQQWFSENPGIDLDQFPFRAEVGRLISLEARNAELVSAQQRRARAEKKNLEQAQRNLRKIQRSYTDPAAATAWQCYS